MAIISPRERRIAWPRIRLALKDIVQAAAPSARVWSRWALKYDLEQTVGLLTAQSDQIHSWMLSVDRVTTDAPKAGGGEFEYNLRIRIWGFLEQVMGDDETNSQNDFENEVDDVIAYLQANRLNRLGISESEGGGYIRDVGFPTFEPIEVHGFGDGIDVHVAQGSLDIRVAR